MVSEQEENEQWWQFPYDIVDESDALSACEEFGSFVPFSTNDEGIESDDSVEIELDWMNICCIVGAVWKESDFKIIGGLPPPKPKPTKMEILDKKTKETASKITKAKDNLTGQMEYIALSWRHDTFHQNVQKII